MGWRRVGGACLVEVGGFGWCQLKQLEGVEESWGLLEGVEEGWGQLWQLLEGEEEGCGHLGGWEEGWWQPWQLGGAQSAGSWGLHLEGTEGQ